jgi:Trk-type K+ transport system membrane component
LRLVIWLLSKTIPKDSETHHSLTFLLHHPRRCYLLLFPKKNTWYLLLIQVGINLLSWVLFILLNLDYDPVTSSIPNAGQRVMDALYQAHGLRAAGYYIIAISSVAPALQVFYMFVMYISAYPFIMSVRQTNIYEERSLGIDDSSKSQTENQGSGSSLLAVSESQKPVFLK